MDRTDVASFEPTASLEALRMRSQLLRELRGFFEEHGYWEVETPVLSHDVVIESQLDPIAIDVYDRGSFATMFLQSSPECGMKRLLCAGADSIYQITHAFRSGESGRLHNPEFMIVEWYRVDATWREQMQVTENLVRHLLRRGAELRCSPMDRKPTACNDSADTSFGRLSWDEAFERATGSCALHLSVADLQELGVSRGLDLSGNWKAAGIDELRNLLLAELVEPTLGCEQPEFVYDYPAAQCALANVRPDDPPVAERFELYIRGIEICNGYQELTSAGELSERMAEQNRIRQDSGRVTLPERGRLHEAMKSGLPECSGVALGFDRLVMLALGYDAIADVTTFPIDRA